MIAGGGLTGNFGAVGDAELGQASTSGVADIIANAGGNLDVTALGQLDSPLLSAGGDIQLTSYTGLGTSSGGTYAVAGHNITQIMSTGPIYGTFIGDHAIGTVTGYDLIDASLTAGTASGAQTVPRTAGDRQGGPLTPFRLASG